MSPYVSHFAVRPAGTWDAFPSIVSADSDKLRSQVSHCIFKLYLTSGCVHPCFRNVDFTRSAVILSGNKVQSYD